MKAHSKGKNYFQRSVAQSVFRSMSGDKTHQVPVMTGDNSMKIGKYKVLLDEELGKGYSCSVYKGVEEGKTMKRYAIKIIELKNFSSSCLELFER
jgi:serine/threonine protein kinase